MIKPISSIGLVCMLAWATPSMAFTGDTSAWVEPTVLSVPHKQGWMGGNDGLLNPMGEIADSRVYETMSANAIIGPDTPAKEVPDSRVNGGQEAGDSGVSGTASANAINTETYVELPRKYGFTRGAHLPLWGAFGDSVSTHIGLNQPNLVEANGLINTSPAGLLGLFAIKTGMVYFLDQQEPGIRKPGLKAMAGLWNGVTMSNLLLAAGASNPVGMIAGVAYGVYMYHVQHNVLEEEEAMARMGQVSLGTATPTQVALP